MKKKSKSLLVIALFVFVTMIAAYAVLPLATTNNVQPGSGDTDNGGSPFGDLGKSRQEELLADMKTFFVGGDPNYWKEWNYQDKVIFAHIQEIDSINDDIVAMINPPPHEDFSKTRWNLHVSCRNDKTIAVSENDPLSSVIDYNFDVLERAKVGDLLIGYCLEEECINIGNKCYLVVRE